MIPMTLTSRGGYPQNNFQQRDRQQQPSAPEPKLNTAFDVNKPSKDLFDATAQACAKEIAKDTRTNKPSQLRRFYDEVVMWTERSETPEDFQNNLPFIYMMKSKVAYAKGRGNVDGVFKDFMEKLINQISETDPKTLKNAKLFMEAMMGFYKECRPKD